MKIKLVIFKFGFSFELLSNLIASCMILPSINNIKESISLFLNVRKEDCSHPHRPQNYFRTSKANEGGKNQTKEIRKPQQTGIDKWLDHELFLTNIKSR